MDERMKQGIDGTFGLERDVDLVLDEKGGIFCISG
jgi:hypothetical protein